MPKFTLGGHEYECPEFISPARKAQARDRLFQIYLTDTKVTELDGDAYSLWCFSHQYEVNLTTLSAHLKPLGEYTVADGYDEATEEQISEVTDFFGKASAAKQKALASFEESLPRRGKRSRVGTTDNRT